MHYHPGVAPGFARRGGQGPRRGGQQPEAQKNVKKMAKANFRRALRAENFLAFFTKELKIWEFY